MTLHDIIVIIAALINLIVFGGCAYWVVCWLRSLKGTVDAQAETISTLKTILDVTDTPKMLERLEAYKKFVDHEKEVLEQSFRRQLEKEKQKSSQSGVAALQATASLVAGMTNIIALLMPYVPREERKKAIETRNFDDQFEAILHRLAEEAPDFSERRPLMRHSELVALLKLEEKEKK
jgi:hypothetical protein